MANDTPESPVNMRSTPEDKVRFFLDLFRCRSDVYALRWENRRDGRSGWMPAIRGYWRKGMNRADAPYLPLTGDIVGQHLRGESHIGLYPLGDDDTCWWAAADFDKEAAMLDALAYMKAARAHQVPAALEVSQSGRGAHVWIFFAQPTSAATARRIATSLLGEAFQLRGSMHLSSYDRLFPSQDLAQEAARDLVRAREDCRTDLMSARHRLSKLLLRQGIVYYGGQAWTSKHELWLRAQRFDTVGLQLAYDAAFDAMVCCVHRRGRLDEAITAMAAEGEFTPVVRRLGCLRGVSTLTAFGLAVEIGDWSRLTGRSIGAYLGLVPTEHSSGASRAQGGVTKTGNGHARRLLVEAAWHHRAPYRPSRDLRRRWDGATAAARARGHAANHRLHTRWVGFDKRKKRPVVANAAIARELAGWCWSLAILDD